MTAVHAGPVFPRDTYLSPDATPSCHRYYKSPLYRRRSWKLVARVSNAANLDPDDSQRRRFK